MVTKDAVLSSLREVLDPEIGVNLVDLGLIREVQIEEGHIEIRMVLTAPGCPLAGYLMGQVREKVEALAQGAVVDVQLLDQEWKPSWM